MVYSCGYESINYKPFAFCFVESQLTSDAVSGVQELSVVTLILVQ
jgi:hypothetical protein